MTYLLIDSVDFSSWAGYLHSLWSQLKENVFQVFLNLRHISKMKWMNWLNKLPFYEIRTTLPQFSGLLWRHQVRHKVYITSLNSCIKYLISCFQTFKKPLVWFSSPLPIETILWFSVFSGKTDPWTRRSLYTRQLQRTGTQPGPQQLGLVNTNSLSLVNTDSFGEDARWEFVEKLIPASASSVLFWTEHFWENFALLNSIEDCHYFFFSPQE